MATKKQKRIAGEQKHQSFMAELRQSGLEAQKRDREYRERKKRKDWQENHDKNHSFKKIIKECPLCQDRLEAAEARKRLEEKEALEASTKEN